MKRRFRAMPEYRKSTSQKWTSVSTHCSLKSSEVFVRECGSYIHQRYTLQMSYPSTQGGSSSLEHTYIHAYIYTTWGSREVGTFWRSEFWRTWTTCFLQNLYNLGTGKFGNLRLGKVLKIDRKSIEKMVGKTFLAQKNYHLKKHPPKKELFEKKLIFWVLMSFDEK